MMMGPIAFLILAIAAAGYANQLDPLCAQGEAYWCGNLYTAKACGAVTHCKTTIWKNQLFNKDNAEICQFCASVIDDIKLYISQRKSKDDITNLMKMACGIIPDRNLATECTTAVEEMVPEIIELINADVDSQVVCSLVGMCSGGTKRVGPAMHPILLTTISTAVTKMTTATVNDGKEPAICVDCKKFFGDVKTWIGDRANEKFIEDLIDKSICAELGAREAECRDYVHMFLPELLAVLSNYVDANVICNSFHFCNSSVKSHANIVDRLSQTKLQLSSPVTCLICETLLAELQALGKDKTIESKLSNLLKTEVCGRIRSSFKSQCEVAVDLYAPMLFQFLASELDPSTKCHSIGVCTASQVKKSEQEQIPVALHSDSSLQVSRVDGPQCVMCEWVMQELASLLENNATEQEIIAGLDKVCSKLPKAVAGECKYFVDTYGPGIIKMLIDDVNAEKICTALHLCSGSPSSTLAPLAFSTLTPVAGAETCLMCETVVRYARAVLAKNATVVEIEAVLDKICNFLPERMNQECRSIVETYSELLIQTLLIVASPKEVCQLVHACEKSTMSRSLPMVRLRSAKQFREVGKEVKEVRVKRKLYGSNPCTWGPAYWCDSSINAQKCNAVEYCKDHGRNV